MEDYCRFKDAEKKSNCQESGSNLTSLSDIGGSDKLWMERNYETQ